jgi:hypothetical protein
MERTSRAGVKRPRGGGLVLERATGEGGSRGGGEKGSMYGTRSPRPKDERRARSAFGGDGHDSQQIRLRPPNARSRPSTFFSPAPSAPFETVARRRDLAPRSLFARSSNDVDMLAAPRTLHRSRLLVRRFPAHRSRIMSSGWFLASEWPRSNEGAVMPSFRISMGVRSPFANWGRVGWTPKRRAECSARGTAMTSDVVRVRAAVDVLSSLLARECALSGAPRRLCKNFLRIG